MIDKQKSTHINCLHGHFRAKRLKKNDLLVEEEQHYTRKYETDFLIEA